MEQRVADGETGHDVVARMAELFQLIIDKHRNETVAVVGHVASLTVALDQLCALGPLVWGTLQSQSTAAAGDPITTPICVDDGPLRAPR